MKTFSFYHRETGDFHAKVVALNLSDNEILQCAADNSPIDHLPIEGAYDRLSQRVEIARRDEQFAAMRTSHAAKVEAARNTHKENLPVELARHESSQQQQKTLRDAAIADAIDNNRPRPRDFVENPFVEPLFVDPVFDEAAEMHKATLAAIVDYQPLQSSVDDEWDAETKRWRLTSAAQERNSLDLKARADIERLQASQHRPIRELALDPTNQDARDRIAEIDKQISALRPNLAERVPAKI